MRDRRGRGLFLRTLAQIGDAIESILAKFLNPETSFSGAAQDAERLRILLLYNDR